MQGASLDREIMTMFGRFLALLATVLCLLPGEAEAQAQARVPRIVSVCAPCHFPDGTGADIEKPNLAGQHSIYLRQQLLAFRSGKRRHPQMSKQAKDLTDREIDQLVVYYSTLLPR